MAAIGQITTAEELLRSPDLGRCELLRGELLMMTPAGPEHGYVTASVTAPLVAYVKRNRLGRVFGAETGFQISRDPDTVRAPDVAFVCAARDCSRDAKGFFQGSPDLAVEVVSPGDRASEVVGKVHAWLDAGCRTVWGIDPATRIIAVHRSHKEVAVLGVSDTLSGGDALPGFLLLVEEVFA